MKNIKIFVILFFVFINITNAEDNIWNLGVMVCLTGECAESGNNSLKAIRLAIKELNNSGGVLGRLVELKIEDTDEGKSSGLGAVTAFKKLTEDKRINYIIGPSWTPGALAVAPLAAKNENIIITSPSVGIAEFSNAGANIFNLWPISTDATKFLAKHTIKKKYKRIAIFSSQQPWEFLQGNTYSNVVKKLGGNIIVKVEPLPTTTDLRSECLKILSVKPDLIFLSNYTQMGVAAKQLRQLGYKGEFLAILMPDSRIKVANGALENTVFAGYKEPSSSFIEAYQKKYSEYPGIGADTTYDVVKIYAKSITVVNSFSTKKVIPTLLKVKHQGASGNIEFDKYGGVKKSPILFQVINGKKSKL